MVLRYESKKTSCAKELEATLSAPQLTDDEKEYLEAFKDACEDGKVSNKQRRLLEKLRVIYEISEERARESEKWFPIV